MQPTQLVLIRHGATAWSLKSRFQGKSDIPLDRVGKQQMQRLTRESNLPKFKKIYTSSLSRAIESAKILSRYDRVTITKDKRINEYDFGSWEGKTFAELRRANDFRFISLRKAQWMAPPGAESMKKFRTRVSKFLKEILKKHRGETVAIVAHGGSLKMILLCAMDFPNSKFWFVRLDLASVSILHFFEKTAQIYCWNRTY